MNGRLWYLIAAAFVLGVASGASADLIAHWTFDNKVTDEVGNLTWALNNGATYSTDAKEGTHSLLCDGVDDYAGLTPTGALLVPFGTQTSMLWFKADSTAGTQVMYDEGGSTNGLAIRLNDGFLETAAQDNHVIFDISTPFSGADWTHVAVSFDNGLLKLFVNAAERGSVMASFTTVSNHSNVAGIGARNGQDAFDNTATGDYFGGLIDDVQIYSEALPPADIEEIVAGRPRAWKPNPPDGAIDVTSPLFSWTPGKTAVSHDVYLGTSPELGPDDLVAPRWATSVYWHAAGVEPGNTYYWKVDEIAADGTVYPGKVWSFTVTPLEAWQPDPMDGLSYVDPNATLTWTKGLNSVSHELYLGTDEAAVAEGAGDTFQGRLFETSYATSDLEIGATYYWRVDEVDAAGNKTTGDIWTFTTMPEIPVSDDMICWWKLDEGMGSRVVDWSGRGHHGAFISEPVWVEGYDGPALNFDDVDDSVMYRFDDETWSAYTVTVWAKADLLGQANNSAICATYGSTAAGFQLSFDLANSYRYHSGIDQVMGPASLSWVHLAVTYGGTSASAYYNGDFVASFDPPDIDLTANKFAIGVNRAEDNWFDGTIDDFRVYNRALTQEEIRLVMRIDPLRAYNPQPVDDVVADVRTASPTTWTAGDNASQHDVYFGADEAAVADADATDTTGVYRGRQGASSYAPPEGVEWGRQYFWRIDEVNPDGSITRGSVWTFTVADYLIIDDFESYTNYSPKRVFQHWVDGLGFSPDEFFPDGDPGNGSTSLVGYDIWSVDSPHYAGTIMETTDVYSGVQAMPVDYDNALTPWYAEATRTWATPQNWLFNDVNTLVLHFKGAPVDFLQTGPDSITMSAAGADIWDVADEFRYVYKRLDGDGEIIARVDSIENTDVWAKGGVMIRESLDPGSRHAMVIVSPSSGVAFQRRLVNNDVSVGTTEAGIAAPRWVKLTRSGNELTAQHSADGVTWVDVGPDPAASTDTVVMGGTIFIGLAVTSHSAGVATTAEFSGISTSGGVSGQWQMAEIGVDHPGNSASTLYVAVEDTAGVVSIVTHPDGTDAVLNGQWRQWPIALDEFIGVNLTSVRRMSVGIGDRNNAQVDGAGLMLFDDFRITQGVPADPNTVE